MIASFFREGIRQAGMDGFKSNRKGGQNGDCNVSVQKLFMDSGSGGIRSPNFGHNKE